MNKPITLAALKNHWHYSWWKYALVAVIAFFGIDLVFTMTAYRPPADKKIEMYICNGVADTEALQERMWPLFQEASPEQELLSIITVDVSSGDIYSNMQFTTYIGAQQGDVCLMPNSQVQKLITDGADDAYLELTPFVESGVLDLQDVDLSGGMMTARDGSTGLYAIPADELYGLLDYSCDPADCSLVVMGYTMNAENAALMIDLFFDEYKTEKPEWYDEYRKAKEEEARQQTMIMQ